MGEGMGGQWVFESTEKSFIGKKGKEKRLNPKEQHQDALQGYMLKNTNIGRGSQGQEKIIRVYFLIVKVLFQNIHQNN